MANKGGDHGYQREAKVAEANAAAMIVAGMAVTGMMALTLPFVLLPATGKHLPYMATPATKLKKALQFIQQQRNSSQQMEFTTNTNTTSSAATAANCTPRRDRFCSFLDLGSGDGEAVYQAAQLVDGNTGKPYYSQCTGVELNSTLYLLSNLRRTLCWTRDQRRRSNFVCRDFWKIPDPIIRESDTILIFGISSLMQPLSEKLARTCQTGTHVLSYRFPLPVANNAISSNNEKDISASLLRAKLIYDIDEMRIYECESTVSNIE